MFFWHFIEWLGNKLLKFVKRAFRGRMRWLTIVLAFGVALFLGVYWPFLSPPSNFPAGTIVTIAPGATVDSVASQLKEENVIRSAAVFHLLMRVSGRESDIIAGEYLFVYPRNVLIVAARLALGRFDLVPIRVTIPEGTTVAEMAQIIGGKLPHFNQKAFLTLATPEEGYLFPDTYYFPPDSTAEDVFGIMRGNFNKEIVPIEASITAFGKPLSSDIIVASMLEKEAATDNDRRIIAGIIWKRLSIGMRLQIDSTLTYALGVSSYQLTQSDLMSTSPYNTYRYVGLPAGPISNPGVDAITDAVTPISTPYLYYVSDKSGKIYYSVTLAEQNQEIKEHL